MQIGIALLSGLIMSLGLIISGMVNPQKVIGFLDIFGKFDPTLAFVMAGALLIAGIGFRSVQSKAKPILCEYFNIPTKTKIDRPLVMGSAIFGIGWGLAGFCPGPAIVTVGLGLHQAIIFVLAMLVGMGAAKILIKNSGQ